MGFCWTASRGECPTTLRGEAGAQQVSYSKPVSVSDSVGLAINLEEHMPYLVMVLLVLAGLGAVAGLFLGGVVASFSDAVSTAKGSIGGLGVGIFLGIVAWVFYATNRR